MQWFEEQGWKRINQGGNGDCGFRSICAASAWNKNSELMSAAQSQREGALLRSQAPAHVRRHLRRYRSSLMPDQATSPEANGPTSEQEQQIVETKLSAMAKPTEWIDGLMLQACAETLGLY